MLIRILALVALAALSLACETEHHCPIFGPECVSSQAAADRINQGCDETCGPCAAYCPPLPEAGISDAASDVPLFGDGPLDAVDVVPSDGPAE